MKTTTNETKVTVETFDVEEMLASYVETALWSSIDDFGDSLDCFVLSDVSEATLNEMKKDCEDFLSLLSDEDLALSPSDLGHDFWLTRNGHGAGFWDGDYESEQGDRLTKLAKTFGSCDLYVSDDFQICSC